MSMVVMFLMLSTTSAAPAPAPAPTTITADLGALLLAKLLLLKGDFQNYQTKIKIVWLSSIRH